MHLFYEKLVLPLNKTESNKDVDRWYGLLKIISIDLVAWENMQIENRGIEVRGIENRGIEITGIKEWNGVKDKEVYRGGKWGRGKMAENHGVKWNWDEINTGE